MVEEAAELVSDWTPSCPECAAYVAGQPTKHKFKCFICDHGGSTEHYEKEASMDTLVGSIMGLKLCKDHAWELEAIRTKRETQELNLDSNLKQEIERTVA